MPGQVTITSQVSEEAWFRLLPGHATLRVSKSFISVHNMPRTNFSVMALRRITTKVKVSSSKTDREREEEKKRQKNKIDSTEQLLVCPQRGKYIYSFPCREKLCYLLNRENWSQWIRTPSAPAFKPIKDTCSHLYLLPVSMWGRGFCVFLLFKTNFLIPFLLFVFNYHLMFWGFQTFSLFSLFTLSIKIWWIDVFANYEIASMPMKKTSLFSSHRLVLPPLTA